jgi:hypothetical protein
VVTIVPRIVFPPAMPPTVKAIAEEALPAPLTIAVKTSEPPAGTLLAAGARLTMIVDAGCTGVVPPGGADVLPQAERNIAAVVTNNKMLRPCLNVCDRTGISEWIPIHTG